MKFVLKKMLIGTIPPPSGGDATWAKAFLDYFSKKGEIIPLVNTSLIGKRALTVDEKRFLIDEIKRCFKIWYSIRNKINEFNPDVVHLNINCSPFGTIRDIISAFIVKFKKKSLILHCHCNVQDQIGESKISKKMLKFLFECADGIIVLNSKSYNYIKKVCKTKVRIIPNFTSKEKKEKKVISNDVHTILYVGHIRKTKGIDELIQSAKLLKECNFILAGPITEDYPQYASEHSYDNVYFTGGITHNQIIQLMDEADVFVFPSYTEGFSIALLEAMSRGLPCVTTDVGSNVDMLEKNGGIFVPVKDYLSIANAINQIRPKEIRKKMSDWNIEKVERCYTIESVVFEIEKFYKEVVDEIC